MPEVIYIRATGDYCGAVEEGVPPLKELVRDALGEPVRRVGRFIQLALVGAGRCVGTRALPPATAVYLASDRGDLEVTLEVWDGLFRQGLAPKPLSFINTVSNSACYYIARQFGLHGRSSFVSSRPFAFESALQLALLELRGGAVASALLGAVELVTPPLSDHRKRLHLDAGTPLAEGSHWLWLQRAPIGEGAPQLLDARHFNDRAALDAWLAALPWRCDEIAFAAGQFLAQSVADELIGAHAFGALFDYREGCGYYDSRSAAVIAAFLGDERCDKPFLLHLNGDAEGRFSALLAMR